MCFSAAASFTMGSVLGVIGTFSMKQVRTPSQIAFASIPFLFTIQQFSEGLTWLTNAGKLPLEWQLPLGIFFLAFAQVVWPTWVPLSFWLLEKDKSRKKILLLLVAVAAVLSFYLAYCLASYPVHVMITGHHVGYKLDYPSAGNNFTRVIYFIVIVFPPFISGAKKTGWLGIALLLSFLLSAFFFSEYLISVWCFFAAAISVMVLVVLLAQQPLKQVVVT